MSRLTGGGSDGIALPPPQFRLTMRRTQWDNGREEERKNVLVQGERMNEEAIAVVFPKSETYP